MTSGSLNWHAGRAAELQVAEHYRRAGFDILAERWRGKWGGEIDLIARGPAVVVFIEVKRAEHHAWAVERVTARQMARIRTSAEEFVAARNEVAQLDQRFDVALVDGTGRIAVIENAHSFD